MEVHNKFFKQQEKCKRAAYDHKMLARTIKYFEIEYNYFLLTRTKDKGSEYNLYFI